jgi:tRNA (cytosine38-C5)-methyltransferase
LRTENSEAVDLSEYIVPDKVLRQSGSCIDIVCSTSKYSSCFTKAYSKFGKGAGSVLQTKVPPSEHPIDRDFDTLKECKLRYFTPKEIANLHGLPLTFSFPLDVPDKNRYGLLGNSLSVTVVKELLIYLISDE